MATVTLQNLTRPGSTNFVVGDTFLVTVSGFPDLPVSLGASLNGVGFGPPDPLGYIDGNGNYSLSGVEGPDAVGSWVENWYVGGVLAQTFYFSVSAAAPAAIQPAGSTPQTPPATSTPQTSPATSTPQTPPATSTTPPQAAVHQDFGSYCDVYPEDPLCQCFDLEGYCSGGAGQPITVVTTVIDNNTVVNEGENATDVAAAIEDALGKLWDATVGAVDAALAAAVAALQKAITDVGNALQAAYNILSRLAGFILNLLKQVVDAVLAGIVKVLEEIRDLLGDLYRNVLVPIVNGLANIRQALLDIYQRFIRPMLIVIQDIRKLLSILALFHVAFAQKLDSALAQLEARIMAPFFYLLSFVNAAANWINLIVTAGYLLQKGLFLNSLNAYIGEALNLQINAMNPKPSPTAIDAALKANAVPTAAEAAQDFNAFITSDSGPLPPLIAAQSDQLDVYLAQGV